MTFWGDANEKVYIDYGIRRDCRNACRGGQEESAA
jgi:hypothetical protein